MVIHILGVTAICFLIYLIWFVSKATKLKEIEQIPIALGELKAHYMDRQTIFNLQKDLIMTQHINNGLSREL